MVLCMPKAGFSLKSVVLVVKSKPKLSDFSRELRQVCGVLVFHCRRGLRARIYYLLGGSIESRLRFVPSIPAGYMVACREGLVVLKSGSLLF